MTDVMIQASGLTKQFGHVRALDNVNFEVQKGEVVGFLGPNGAGKSTTMRILTCFISPTSGMAKVHGFDVFDDPLAVRRNLGYLPQRAPLYTDMNVWEYLEFAAQIRGLDASTFKTRLKKVVEVCGLAQVLGKDIGTLSHGYRQRVGLGQALIHDPPSSSWTSRRPISTPTRRRRCSSTSKRLERITRSSFLRTTSRRSRERVRAPSS
jgi:ABC-2 type transport system ATP-binding protein